jgi:nucleotide-binding universal stress UspA family protein
VVASAAEGPYRRPLVAVDCSDASARALEMAIRIAGGGAIDVVHAYRVVDGNLLPDVVLPPREVERYLAEAEEEAGRKLKAWLPRPKGIDLNVTLVPGDPRLAIAERAAASGADLIVVGHHDRSLLGRMILGSVSSAIVRSASLDVLVVR